MTTLTTLVIGIHARARETAIAALIAPDVATAVILEGMPDGADRLWQFTDLPHF